MKVIAFVCLILASAGFSDSATQNSWLGGAGAYGPLNPWNSEYWYGSGVSAVPGTGALSLGREITSPVCHVIDYQEFFNRWAAVADVDGDGHQDVISCRNMGEMVVSRNVDGTGENWQTEVFQVNDEWDSKHLFPLDVDNDGDIDVLFGTHLASFCMENSNGMGTEWIVHPIDTHVMLNEIAGFDFEGDGDIDVVILNDDSHEIVFYTSTNGTDFSWELDQSIGDIVDPHWCQIVDMNGDGKQDLLFGGYNTAKAGGGTGWIENRYPESWELHWMAPNYPFRRTRGAIANDWDGDGDMDIMMPEKSPWSASVDTTHLRLFENVDGSGLEWEMLTIQSWYVSGISLTEVLDIDSDGDLDLLGYNHFGDKEIFILENVNGYDQPYVQHTLLEPSVTCHCYCSADFNEDNFPDLLVSQCDAFPDTGRVEWVECIQPAEEGVIESSVLYLGNDPGWDQFSWNSTTPSGSQIAFQVKSSDDYMDLGEWSDTLFSPGSLEGILEENDSYFMYKAILSAGTAGAPVLDEVTLSWTPLGISEEGESGVLSLNPLQNPSRGHSTVVFYLPEPSMASLQVFDLSGRVEASVDEVFSEGMNELVFDGLPTGVHFCRLTVDNSSETVKLVVN